MMTELAESAAPPKEDFELEPEMDDAVVVRRVLAGDRQAFGTLVERYQRRIFRVCMAVTKDQDAAEDCLQNTFILALENLGQYRAEARFSTWLTRIALNAALSHRRRQNSAVVACISIEAASVSEQPLDLPDHRHDPETSCWRGEVRHRIRQALESLSPRLRTVFVLRDMEELSTEETARSLGITEAAVKTRLLRARLQLRELLAPALFPNSRFPIPCALVQ